jgi:SAM-dependent methyltransferase
MLFPAFFHRLFFELSYRLHRTPWDTGISPPELRALIEGPTALPPGHMLDLGCGTGLNLVYAATHGWSGVGVDFAAPAIAAAHHRTQAARLPPGRVQFFQGDVTRLDTLPLHGPFDLLFDLGCFHGLGPVGQTAYLQGVAPLLKPGAPFLLYAFTPRISSPCGTIAGRHIGLTPAQLEQLATPTFQIIEATPGTNPAYWYTLHRTQ